MKKIGIITFHKSINYGSVLQAYSLQHLLESEGYLVEIIDYEPKKYKELYTIFNHNRNVSENLNRIPLSFFHMKKYRDFSCFRKKHLNLSKQKYFFNTDYADLNKYDCLISGSDQIWNVVIKDCDPLYFFPNLNVKKITYAISVGNSNFTDVEDSEKYSKWISDYAHITVREKKTKEKLNNFLKNEVDYQCVLDPTLLHDKRVFENISSKRLISEKYIFIYNIWNIDNGFEMARTVSKKLDMPVYTMLNSQLTTVAIRIHNNKVKIKLFKNSPSDYLSLLSNSSFVITDSFHGTAFSIIFEKPFICVNYELSNGKFKDDVRLNNVLSFFGLNHRYITKYQLEKLDLNEEINYNLITKKRMELAKESIDLLIDNIEN